MPLDLTKPADHSPVVAAELRAQFNAIADDIDGTALNPGGSVLPLSLTLSNPPTQAQVQAILDKLNDLISTISR